MRALKLLDQFKAVGNLTSVIQLAKQSEGQVQQRGV